MSLMRIILVYKQIQVTLVMGSRKGIPNQPKRMLVRRLKDAYGEDFNIIMEMAVNGKRMQEVADISYEALTSILSDLEADHEAHDAESILLAMGRVRATATDAVNVWDRVAQYIQPKLKAVEIVAETNGTQDHNWKVEFVNAIDNPLLKAEHKDDDS